MRNRPPTILLLFLTFILIITVGNGCSLFVLESSLSPDEYIPKTTLLVVDEAIYPEIQDRIETYQADLSKDGIASSMILWSSSDDSAELKSVLQAYNGKAESGFFIGKIPPAWYEQTAFEEYEVFPSDLYYMDLDSLWTDSNGNGYFDSHTDLQIDFYISRMTGSSEEINFYFDKLHGYRTRSNDTPIYDGAFIFKDDDWHDNYRNNNFGLDAIYGSIDFYQDTGNTTRSGYLSKMSDSGAEYVYQWIHAYPPALFVAVDDSYEIIKADDFIQNDLKGNFYNLFDCQAARFTVKNIANSYLTKTDSCIAILGSTKTGGVFYPIEFHKSLGLGACWGAAYKSWYNTEGCKDDKWNLGMIIMGDPTIRPHNAAGSDLSSGSRSVSNIIPISEETKEEMYFQMKDFTPPDDLSEELLSDIEQSLHDY